MTLHHQTFLNFKETCEFLNISDSHLRKLVFEKRISHFKVGKLLRFSKEDLLAWLETNHNKSRNAGGLK